jgi:hypothetical protein
MPLAKLSSPKPQNPLSLEFIINNYNLGNRNALKISSIK